MSAHGNKVRTGTFLPNFQGFDPQKPYSQLGPFCEKYKVSPETIRSVVVEPALISGQVVSFRGEAPLFTYSCGKNPDAITRMAETVISRSGLSANPEASKARNELWQILRDFSMGYGIPVEEQIGLITKSSLQEKFNFSSVHTLTTMRFFKDITASLEGHSSSFGKISSAYLDLWVQNMEQDAFSAVFSMFIQGQISMNQDNGSVLSINPTHCRSLVSPSLPSDIPHIVSTAQLASAFSISSILPAAEMLGIRLDLLLWRKADTLVIADVTGSFA